MSGCRKVAPEFADWSVVMQISVGNPVVSVNQIDDFRLSNGSLRSADQSREVCWAMKSLPTGRLSAGVTTTSVLLYG